MLRDLRIKNFRGFRQFSMSGLGRVNLLVGTNNCGKTSVLEAIHIFSTPGDPLPLWQDQIRRGELIEGAAERQIDVSHLVHGHQLEEGSGFSVVGEGTSGRQALAALFDIRELMSKGAEGENGDGESESARALAYLRLEWSGDTPRGPTAQSPRGYRRPPYTHVSRCTARRGE